MGIEETESKTVAPNAYAKQILSLVHNIEMAKLEKLGKLDVLFNYFEANKTDVTKGSEEVMTSYINKLAELDIRFEAFKR